MLASDYAQSNRLPEAVTLLERAHKAQPDDAQISASLGDLYIRSGNAQKALDLAVQTKGALALSDPILGLTAASQLALGQRDRARDTYSQLLKQDPTNLGVRRRLVGLLVDAGNYDTARNVVKAGIAANPRNYQLLLDYALIDLRATGVDAALSTAEQPDIAGPRVHCRAGAEGRHLSGGQPSRRRGQGLPGRDDGIAFDDVPVAPDRRADACRTPRRGSGDAG